MLPPERQHKVYDLLMGLSQNTFSLKRYNAACTHLETALNVALSLDDADRIRAVQEAAQKLYNLLKHIPAEILQPAFNKPVLLQRYMNVIEQATEIIDAMPVEE